MANDFTAALKKLEKEKVRLTAQLADVNTAIDSLQRVNASLSGESVVLVTENGSKKEKVLPYNDYTVLLPSRYDSDLTLPEMLIYALKSKNGAFAHDAAEFIFSVDDTVDVENLKKRFTDIASAMARAGKLDFKKIGKKYRYFIKDEHLL